MFEWRVTAVCPVHAMDAIEPATSNHNHQRDLYVWTDNPSAVDAYDEAWRVLQGWPQGSRPVDVTPMGMYVPTRTTADMAA